MLLYSRQAMEKWEKGDGPFQQERLAGSYSVANKRGG
jgi:hypothetical protein